VVVSRGALAGREMAVRAARAAAPPPVRKQAPAPTPIKTAQIIPVPVIEPPKTETAPPPPVITQAEVTKRIAEQEEKRKKIEEAKKPVVVTATPLPPVEQPAELRRAYRAFAEGDLATSEQLLTRLLSAQPATAEAYLLRGCARYTRAALSRTPDPLLALAADDFRSALQRNRALRLSRDAFSPKLIAYFEQVRSRR